MARGEQITRQLRLMQLLEGSVGRTLDQLRAELGVTKRTIQRDLTNLQEANLPVISETRDGTVFWRFIDGFHAGCSISFTLPEMMALYFSKGLIKPLQGTPFHDALQTALHKIGAAIPAQGLMFLKSVNDEISITSFGCKDYRQSRETLQQLTKAVSHHLTVEISYTASGYEKPLARRFDPYRLWYVNNGLYLVGFDHRNNETRVFAVERISAVTSTNRRFEIPADFVFEELTKTAFQMIWGEPQTVRIRFSPEQAPYIEERTWHSSQKIIKEPDSSIILELSVANLWEVKRWLIGWGAAAEVLEPTELHEDIQNECRSLLGSAQ